MEARTRRLCLSILLLGWAVVETCWSQAGFLITTVAGNGNVGFGTDGIAATASPLFGVDGIAVDAQGNVYVGEAGYQAGKTVVTGRVRRVDTAGIITTVAGTTANGSAGDGGPATSTRLGTPEALAVDSSGSLYILEQVGALGQSVNGRIRIVTKNGTISTFASNLPGALDFALDTAGNLYVAETQEVVKLTPGGSQTVVAGTGACTFSGLVTGISATQVELCGLRNVAVDSNGNIYLALVTDQSSQIPKVTTNGIIQNFAGTGALGGGVDGIATSVKLGSIGGLGADMTGNVYFSEFSSGLIRRVRPDGYLETIAGGGPNSPGDGGVALSASTPKPVLVAVAPHSQSIYFGQDQGYRVRELVPASVGLPQPVIPLGSPLITAVTNAGSGGTVSFNSLITIRGENLSITTATPATIPWPTSLGDTQVSFCDASSGIDTFWLSSFSQCAPAQLIYVSPTQIDAFLPDSPGSYTVPYTVAIRVVSGRLTDQDTLMKSPFMFRIFPVAPGFFRMGYDCSYPQACSLTPSPNAPASVVRGSIIDLQGLLVSSQNPIRVGQSYSAYLTGAGLHVTWTPIGPVHTGNLVDSPPTVYIVNPANGNGDANGVAIWIGPSVYPGLYQVDFALPYDLRRVFTSAGASLPSCQSVTSDVSTELMFSVASPISGGSIDQVSIPVFIGKSELACGN